MVWRRYKPWIIGLTLIVAVGLIGLAVLQRDPMAVKVRKIVTERRSGGEAYTRAVQQLLAQGPKAGPHVSNLLKARDTKIEQVYDELRKGAPGSLQSILPKRQSKRALRRDLAELLWDIGPMARCYVNGIVKALKLSKDPTRGQRLLRCLYWSIPESQKAVDGLRYWLANPKKERLLFGFPEAREIWPKVPEFAPLLIDWLKLPDQARDAAAALGLMGEDAAAAVPHLISVYRQGVAGKPPDLTLARSYTDNFKPFMRNRAAAIKALGRIGKMTPPVTQALRSGLAHTNAMIRAAAAEAVEELGPKGLSLLPVVIENLDTDEWEVLTHDWRVLKIQLRAIGKMGPGASNAIPTLKKWARPTKHGVLPLAEERKDSQPEMPPLVPVTAGLSLWRVAPSLGRTHADVIAEGLAEGGWDPPLDELQPLADKLVNEIEEKLDKKSGWQRVPLAFRILSLDRSHDAARECLLNEIQETTDVDRKATAARYFYEATGRTNRVLSALRETLKQIGDGRDGTALHSATALGKDAKPLVPQLRPLIRHKNDTVRELAGKALRTIDPSALPPIGGR